MVFKTVNIFFISPERGTGGSWFVTCLTCLQLNC